MHYLKWVPRIHHVLLCSITAYIYHPSLSQPSVKVENVYCIDETFCKSKIKHSMDFGRPLFQLPQEHRKSVRKIENISKKLINANFAVIFNDICIRENLLPTFTNIRTLDPAVRQSDFTLRFRKDLLHTFPSTSGTSKKCEKNWKY